MTNRDQPTEFQAKVDELSMNIRSSLLPLIVSDYVLLDCPFYPNIGDMMIWQGELEMLKGLPYKCLGQSSLVTFRESAKVKPSTTILLQGGGNFGDLWRDHSEFRLKIVEEYPENPIIIFPQSVYYRDKKLMARDAEVFARHKNLTICARDINSYEILDEHFKNNVLLVPDMAFCMDVKKLNRWSLKKSDRTLYLQRNDKELKDNQLTPQQNKSDVEVRDWPTFEHRGVRTLIMVGLARMLLAIKGSELTRWMHPILAPLMDCSAKSYMKYAVKQGVRFISPYKKVYSTRLHAGILSILLGVKCQFIDNSYGKNSSYFNTWLNGMEEVKLDSESQ